jgi:hypothetical protein
MQLQSRLVREPWRAREGCRCDLWKRAPPDGATQVHPVYALWLQPGPQIRLLVWVPSSPGQRATRSICAVTHSLPSNDGVFFYMLHDFLTSNRNELIRRCRDKVAKRSPKILAIADQGVPLFLQQLVDTLRREQSTGTRHTSGPKPTSALTEIGRTAALHGAELLRRGYSVDQVVHDYGDVCQAVTELAIEQKADVTTDEFRTLNRCLDNAIADAVTAYTHDRDGSLSDKAEKLHNRAAGSLADEQRRLIDVAIQTFSAIKTGNIGLAGATGTVLVNCLFELRDLIDQARPGIRFASGTDTLPPP